MHRIRGRVLILCMLVFVSACAGLPKAPSKADPRTVYVWPVSVCPSQASGGGGARVGPILAGLGVVFVGDLINAAIDVPVSALTSAAAADKTGFQASGINARYFYSVAPNADSTAYVLYPPSCYVIAYAKPVDTPASWCAPGDFKSGVPATCSQGSAILSALKIRETLYNGTTSLPDSNNTIDYLSVPELYVEVELDPSGYSQVVRPRVVAMYYPQTLLEHDVSKDKMLSLSVAISSPLANDPFKAAQLSILFPSITSSASISDLSLRNAVVGWTSVPTTGVTAPNQSDMTTLFKNQQGFLPVTMTPSLSEVGDPNVFLAAFAQAFGGSVSDYQKAVTNGISMFGVPSTDSVQRAQASSTYYAALGAAQQSLSQLAALCAKAPLSSSDKTNALGLYNVTISKQEAANLSAAQAKIGPPFAKPDSVAGVPQCW